MKTKDLMTMATVALGTATLTVMTFWSGPLEAGLEGDALAAKIAKPKLVSHGVELTLAAAEGRIFKAGDEPAFALTAVNTTGEPAAVTVRLAMTASSLADAMSRVPRMPTALWQQPQSLTLKPHETKTVVIPVQTKLPVSSMIAVSLQESNPLSGKVGAASSGIRPALQFGPSPQAGIVALNFSTIVAVAQTAAAK